MTHITNRRAWPDEIDRACRLFKIPFANGPNLHLFVAVTGEARERMIACAAVFEPEPDSTQDHAPAAMYWESLPAYKDSEIAATLIEFGCVEIAKSGIEKLITLACLPESEPRIKLLQQLGFAVTEAVDEYQAPYDAVWQRCRRIHKVLEKRNSIPADAHCSGITGERLFELRTLFHNEHIIQSADFDARRHEQHPEPIDMERSTVIEQCGKLIGAMIVCPMPADKGYLVLGRWVAEPYRNGWANALLIYNSVRQGVALNLEFVRFVANQNFHQETVRLAKRLGGHRVVRKSRFGISLNRTQEPV